MRNGATTGSSASSAGLALTVDLTPTLLELADVKATLKADLGRLVLHAIGLGER